jgi:hypothetical protein
MMDPKFEQQAVEKNEYWTREASKYVAYFFSPETWVYKLGKTGNLADHQKEFCPDCFENERIVQLQDGCCPSCQFQILDM